MSVFREASTVLQTAVIVATERSTRAMKKKKERQNNVRWGKRTFLTEAVRQACGLDVIAGLSLRYVLLRGNLSFLMSGGAKGDRAGGLCMRIVERTQVLAVLFAVQCTEEVHISWAVGYITNIAVCLGETTEEGVRESVTPWGNLAHRKQRSTAWRDVGD